MMNQRYVPKMSWRIQTDLLREALNPRNVASYGSPYPDGKAFRVKCPSARVYFEFTNNHWHVGFQTNESKIIPRLQDYKILQLFGGIWENMAEDAYTTLMLRYDGILDPEDGKLPGWIK